MRGGKGAVEFGSMSILGFWGRHSMYIHICKVSALLFLGVYIDWIDVNIVF